MSGSVHESANNDFYNRDSTSYDTLRWTSKSGAYTNAAQQHLLEELCHDWHDTRVLEVGSGTGRFTIPLLRRGAVMTLADVSAGMLSVVKENIEKAGLSARASEFRECSIYNLPFEDNTFDHAVSLNVFNHLERPADALNELGRVIKRGSTLVFNYANLSSYYWPAARSVNKSNKAVGVDVYSSWVRPGDMRKAIKSAELELVSLLGNVHMPRALEPYGLGSVVRALDRMSRRGWLKRFAPFHFCLLRKP